MRLFLLVCYVISFCQAGFPFNNTRRLLNNNKIPEIYNLRQVLPQNDFGNKEEVINEPSEPSFNLTGAQMEYFKIWPQGAIPYYIDNFSYKDKVLRDRIRNFLSEVNSLTEINFMELPSPPPDDGTRWVFFVNRRGLLGCADHSVTNLSTKGVQQVVLGYDCMSTRNELAEAILSIVGVPSQHNAPDRDNYIEVITENIIPEKRFLFEKINEKDWLFSHLDYDFKSAGHFDTHKYSRNGKATIRIKDENFVPNSVKKLSVVDIKKMKMLYKWKKSPTLDECQKLFMHGDLKSLQMKVGNIYSNINVGGDFNPVQTNINAQYGSQVIYSKSGCPTGNCGYRKPSCYYCN